jgi:hypothetical protein
MNFEETFIFNGVSIAFAAGMLSNAVTPIEIPDTISDEDVGKAVRVAVAEYRYWKAYNITLTYDTAVLRDVRQQSVEEVGRIVETCQWMLDFYALNNKSVLPDAAQRAQNIRELLQTARPILEALREDEERDYLRRQVSTIKSRPKQPGYIYLLKATTPDIYYKIGLSKKPVERIASMGVLLPFPIAPLHHFPTNDMKGAEGILHQRYDDKRADGEWFALSEQDVADICAIEQMEL